VPERFLDLGNWLSSEQILRFDLGKRFINLDCPGRIRMDAPAVRQAGTSAETDRQRASAGIVGRSESGAALGRRREERRAQKSQ